MTPPTAPTIDAPPARRRSGPPPRLTAEMIAEAVIAVGFDRASMTSVAHHLSCAHGALYRHIGDRDGMMRAALALAIERYAWPEPTDDWSEAIRNEARAWWAFCEQHPGFATALATTPGMPAPMSRRAITVSVHLHALGVDSADAVVVVDMVMDMVHDIFHRAAQRTAVIEHARSMSPEDAAAYIAGVPDEMLEVVAGALIDDPWPWFTRKLELTLRGVRFTGT